MKPNSEKDFWSYISVNGYSVESYCIDGIRMSKHTAAQYLIEKYNISDSGAYWYLDNVNHI
jgi:hypothetical protein